MNLVGDYGGGSLYLALGVMAALFEARRSGKGQVVDAAIVDGVASMLVSFCGLWASGQVQARGTNPTDSGSHFYDSYLCADGKWICVGAIEDKFYQQLLTLMGIDPATVPSQWDASGWSEAKRRFAERFLTKTRDEWCALLEGTDACFAPVLDLSEAQQHPHMVARNTFIAVDGVVQPAPAPRFSRTVPTTPTPPRAADPAEAADALDGWISPDRVTSLLKEDIFG